jgi:hemoglobin
MYDPYMFWSRGLHEQVIDESQLEKLIPHFYALIRRDELLSPLFNAAISDWPGHMDKLIAFWSSVMLTSGRYKGNPMAAHLKHGTQITPAMFERWLALWSEATSESLPAPVAAALQAKAARIAESLSLALFFRLDGPTANGAASISGGA